MPNPGSDEAIKLGCCCPVMDNAHGRRNDGLFWIVADCPLHGCGKVAMTEAQLDRLAQHERMMMV